MHALILDTSYLGHSLAFIRLLANALGKLGARVSVALPGDALHSPQYEEQIRTQAYPVEFVPLPTVSSSRHGTHSRHALRALLHLIAELRVNHVYLPHADRFVPSLGVLGLLSRGVMKPDIELEGLILRGGFAYHGLGLARSLRHRVALWLTAYGPWVRVHYLDPRAYRVVQERGGRLARMSRLMPDPIPTVHSVDRSTARQALGLPEDGRLICLPGAVDSRKGSDVLLRGFAMADLKPSDRLMLAGRVPPEMQSAVSEFFHLRHAGRLLVSERYISDREFALSILASDLVVTPYPRHVGSASVVLRAAASERPVLATDFGWMGDVVRGFSLGWTFWPCSPAALAAALPHALTRAREFRLSQPARDLIAFHNEQNFQRQWTQRIRERMGLSDGPSKPLTCPYSQAPPAASR